jgi:TRAP-type transport system periplasmic protein
VKTNDSQRRKKMRRVVPVLAVAFFLTGVLLAGTASAEVTLKALTAWPKTSTEFKAFSFFTEEVEKIVGQKAPGELKIQYIGGPEAVKSPDQVEATQRGMVDLVFTTNAYYLSVLPEADALKLTDFTPAQERTNGAWAYVNELHKGKGLYYMGRLGIQIPFQLYLKKPIKSADLKGLNIRVSPMYLAAIKGLGGNPVVIAPTEVYQALQRNVVDGYCWPAVGIRDWGWEKETKYAVEPTFYTGPNPLIMNLNTWNKLPKKLQDILTEATKEAEIKAVAFYMDLIKGEKENLAKAGIQTIDLPGPEKEKFLKVAYEEGWKLVIEKSPKAGPELRKLLTKTK